MLDVNEDAEGRLVLATQGGGLCIRENGGFTLVRQGRALVNDYVQRLTRDRDGTLWAATEGGITHLTRPPVHYTVAEGLPSNNVLLVHRDRRGRLWAATTRGLALFSGTLWSPVHADRLGGATLRALLDWGDDLLIGGDGVLLLDRGGRLVPFPVELPPGRTREVHDALVTSQGALWLATADGAFRWDGRVLERYGARQGLLGGPIHRLLLDREGDLWFGTEAGASKLGPSPFVGYTDADGLVHPFVRALGEDALGRVFAGTRTGVSIFDGSGFSTLREGLPNERIYAFAALPDGRMLVGTRGGLALTAEGRVQRALHVADGLPDEYVTSLLARPDAVVVGTAHGMALYRSGRLTPIPDPLLAKAYVLAMRDDSRGRIWVGLRSGGVAVWDGTLARLLPLDSRMEGETVWSIDRDSRGRMWVGTNGLGVFVVDGDAVTRLTTRDGLVNDFVWQVLADDQGNVWCYTSHGIDRTDAKTFTHFGVEDGLLDLEGSAAAALKQRNGDLWFGSGSGLSRFVPARLSINTVPPPVLIEAAEAGATPIASDARLQHDSGSVRFSFAALSFRSESAVRFRHRLLPVEAAWSEPSAERRIEFGRLAPGRYVFEVMATNDAGVPSRTPARFPFSVRPPWWGTLLFRVGLLLAVTLFGIGLGTLRNRRAESERRRLTSIVAARTAELEERNTELRRLATSDALTGVANRRHFLDVLAIELKRASRVAGGGSVALVMLDLDHFKEVNDAWGHSVGDQVLTALAARLRAAVRTTDLVARYGGEEFVVFLPETRLAGATTIARKLHATVGERPFEVEERAITLSVSCGVSALEGIADWDEGLPRSLVDRADTALYRAKTLGRNRVELEADTGV